jgi:hypothetical protein
LWRLGDQADLVDAEAAEHVEHVHHALVLALAVAAHDDGHVRGGGFDPAEPAFEFGQGDGGGVELDPALGTDGDGLGEDALLALGRLTLTPCTLAVVMMMKMSSSTR